MSGRSCSRATRVFYGMARPSFRHRKVAGGSKGGMGIDIAVLGVDLGKNVCSVVGLDASGAIVMRRKVRRETLMLWRRSLLHALSGWRPAAAPIISVGCSPLTATILG
jgi:hypothetical protein